MKFLHYFFIVLFLLFAAVQYNDPDPLIWIPLYLIPAFMVFQAIKNNVSKDAFLYAGLVYLLYGISLYPPEWEGLTLNSAGMKTMNIELGRETFGLIIVAVILFVEFIVLSRKKA